MVVRRGASPKGGGGYVKRISSGALTQRSHRGAQKLRDSVFNDAVCMLSCAAGGTRVTDNNSRASAASR